MIDPRKKERYIKLRSEGYSQAAAARMAEISLSSAKRIDAVPVNGQEFRKAREGQNIPDRVIPFDQLCDEAKRGLEDFEFFRSHYLGHTSTPWQIEAANIAVNLLETPAKEFLIVNCPPGTGKALALDTPILTTQGWRTMKGLEVGDEVYGTDGRPCRVTFKSEVFYDHYCYEVRSDDGASVIADADHLWRVRLNGHGQYGYKVVPDYPGKTGPQPSPDGRQVHTTEFLAAKRAKRPQLELAAPLVGPTRALPVDPYVLGAWLGDGHAAGAKFTSCPEDAPHFVAEFERAGYTVERKGDLLYSVTGSAKWKRDGLASHLRRAGVLHNKHIPDAYLRSAPEQRRALLQGLVDTDGSVDQRGMVEFCSTNPRLAHGVQFLVRSLGAKASLKTSPAKIDGREVGTRYRVTFYLAHAARLHRKAERCRDGTRTPSRYLTVTPTGSVPTQCIQVDSPDHCYLAGEGLMVTHNTTLFTHDIPAWLTVRDRKIRGIIGSRTMRQASAHLNRLRRTLERVHPMQDATGVLAKDFGRFRPDRGEELWSKEAVTVVQPEGEPSDDKEPTWTAFGQDSGQLGWRVDYVTWDDVVDRTTVRTIEAVETQQGWWDDEAETRLEPGGVLVLPGQRIRSNDLYRYNLDKRVAPEDEEDSLGEPQYRHIIYKAHYEDRCEGVHKPSEAKPYPDGCLLDPQRLPWRDLRAIIPKREKFEVLYQQQDVDPANVLVPSVWISGGRDSNGIEYPGCWDHDRGLCEPPRNIDGRWLSVISTDPSPTKFWAVGWWLVSPEDGGLRYLMDLYRQKMEAYEYLYADRGIYTGLLEEWRVRAERIGRPITHHIYEENAAQRFYSSLPFWKDWHSRNRISYIPHQTHLNKVNAEYGVQMIAPQYEFGRVRLPGKQNNPGRGVAMKLVDEVTHWPDVTTEDCVMQHWMMEHNMERLRVPSSKPVKEERPSWIDRPLSSFLRRSA